MDMSMGAGPGQPSPSAPLKWPARDEQLIASIEADGPGLVDLWEASPVRFSDNKSYAEQLVDALFPGNPLLCVARHKPADALTRPREAWRGHLAECALMVPSPMTALTGRTQSGHQSPRCLENVGPRKYLVIEFDSGALDGQAARLWYLGQMAPLALVVHSGAKSLHGWFPTQGKPDSLLRHFMARSVIIGADPAYWTPCQLVRLPDGRRDTGQPQRVFFFNPQTLSPLS